MTSATYAVRGMTCSHCVNAVSTEIAKLPGINDVGVELDSGTVTVNSEQPLDPDAVRAAVDQAGYELVV
ncbi:MAG: heavy-metal-associated domain-containing protein [Acidimicrobiales bacterium]